MRQVGNPQLSAVTRQGGGSSTFVGYTSFVVARQNPDGSLLGPPPSTEYGTHAYLTQTLGNTSTKFTTISCRRR